MPESEKNQWTEITNPESIQPYDTNSSTTSHNETILDSLLYPIMCLPIVSKLFDDILYATLDYPRIRLQILNGMTYIDNTSYSILMYLKYRSLVFVYTSY